MQQLLRTSTGTKSVWNNERVSNLGLEAIKQCDGRRGSLAAAASSYYFTLAKGPPTSGPRWAKVGPVAIGRHAGV